MIGLASRLEGFEKHVPLQDHFVKIWVDSSASSNPGMPRITKGVTSQS